MTSYVKDNAPAGWVDGDVYLWHRVTGVSFTENGVHPGVCRMAGIFLTACGRRVVSEVPEVIHGEMTLTDWDARFGDDVDLCECAVNQADAPRVAGAAREST